jgi:intracellular septation protein A
MTTTTQSQTTTQNQQKQAGWRAMIPGLVLDIAAPVAAYYGLTALGASAFWALTAGGLVSGARVLFTVIKDRKLDGFALFMLALFAFGIATAFLTGDAKFVLAKESLGSGLAGLIFLGTLVVGKPLIYYMGRRFAGSGPEALAEWERKYATNARFRQVMWRLTAIWGVGLLLDAALRIVLIYLLPLSTMVALSTVLQIAFFGVLILISVKYVRRVRRSAQRVRNA